jgi:hypothetical protein
MTMTPNMKAAERARRTVAENAGMTTYQSQRPCVHGHIGQRYLSNGACVACAPLRRQGALTPLPRRTAAEAAELMGPVLVDREVARKHGLPVWFDGTECKHGHVSHRYSSSGNCLACHANRARGNRAKRGAQS